MIPCPEHRAVVVEMRDCVQVYLHADDKTLCEYLNMFRITPEVVLRTYLANHTFDADPGVLAAFSACEEAKFDLFRELSQASESILAKKLDKIYTFCQKMGDWSLIKAIYDAFGYVSYENFKIVTGQEYVPGTFNRMSHVPTWKMRELDATYTPTAQAAKVAIKLQEEVAQTRKKTLEFFQKALQEQKTQKRKA